MLSVLLALHFIVTIIMIGLILIQKHEGGGLAGGLSSAANNFVSSRGQANILTKATAVLMTIFVVNCLVMAKIAKGSHKTTSFVDAAANEINLGDKTNFDQTDAKAAADANTHGQAADKKDSK